MILALEIARAVGEMLIIYYLRPPSPEPEQAKIHKSFWWCSHTTKIALLVKPASEPKLNLNMYEEKVDMKMSPFSAPFSGAPKSEGLLLPKRAAALWEGTQWCKGGTGTSEVAKLAGRRN